jgi:hypothetical protein
MTPLRRDRKLRIEVPSVQWKSLPWWWLFVAAAGFVLLIVLFWLPKPPLLSVSCDTIVVPLRITEPVFGVLLHPQWGNQLVTGVPRFALDGASYWPSTQTAKGSGYRCEFLNEGDDVLSGVTMDLEVAYRASNALLRTRTIALPLANPLRPKETFRLHIVDDTGWDPEVVLPLFIKARVGDSASPGQVRLRYSTHDASPYRLSGFGP